MKTDLKHYITTELLQLDQPESLQDDDDLFEAGLDSMGIMRLILFIEEKLGVSLPDQEVTPENLVSINAICQWIQQHQ